MPRDGSGNFTKLPPDDVISGTTIESAGYNLFTNDVEFDLNWPRPISTGGTGATSARDAMIALSGEIATQGPVTNFDTFPFVSGSFYCNPSATAAPTPDPYSGICYVHGVASNVTLEARNVNTPANKYVRSKVAGVWGAWVTQISSTTDLDARFVNVAGDVMTGDLTAPNLYTTGQIIVGNTSPNVGILRFGNNGTKYISSDGVNSTFNCGIIFANNSIAANNDVIAGQGSPTIGTFRFGNNSTKYLQYDGSNFNLVGSHLFHSNSLVANFLLGQSSYNLDAAFNGISAASGATVAIIPAFSGMIISTCWGSGLTDIFACGGGSVMRIGGSTGTAHTTVIYAAGQNGYALTNASGSTATFGVIALRTRNTG